MIFSLVPLNSKMVYRPSFERYAVSVIVDGFRFEDKGKKKRDKVQKKITLRARSFDNYRGFARYESPRHDTTQT